MTHETAPKTKQPELFGSTNEDGEVKYYDQKDKPLGDTEKTREEKLKLTPEEAKQLAKEVEDKYKSPHWDR